MINPLELPALKYSEKLLFPKTPCIYFVVEKAVVLYVGRTKNLFKRWLHHHKDS